MSKKAIKVTLLEEINKKKQILFGALTPKITKQTKQEAWKEIYATALSLGVIGEEKNWTYVRDTIWPNLRKRALEKKDNARKTGTGGGKEAKMTEVDNKVLEILGKDSMGVQGIGVADTLESDDENEESFQIEAEISAAEALLQNSGEIQEERIRSPTPQPPQSVQNQRPIKKTAEQENNAYEMHDLKKKKLLLEIDYLTKLNRKTDLEVLKLEKELNINM